METIRGAISVVIAYVKGFVEGWRNAGKSGN
jgi:hypothetical protein